MTINKVPAKVSKIDERKYNLNNSIDFKDCLKKVLGNDVTQEVIELYYYAFVSRNRELYEFMKSNAGSAMDDGNLVIKVSIKERENGIKLGTKQEADGTASVGK